MIALKLGSCCTTPSRPLNGQAGTRYCHCRTKFCASSNHTHIRCVALAASFTGNPSLMMIRASVPLLKPGCRCRFQSIRKEGNPQKTP
eukprot:1354599-Amphidinium_carterae.1